MKNKRDVLYVSLEPGAFLADPDFTSMTAEERGVYWTIILYLYTNNGRLKNDPNLLTKLCNASGQHCIQVVLKKFRVRYGFIEHKRVSKELNRAQLRKEQALKAANTRWKSAMHQQCISNAQQDASAMLSEVKGSKVINKEKIQEKKGASPPFSLKEFIAYWNSKTALPKVVAETTGRQAKFRVRSREPRFADNWRQIVDSLAASPFHTGKNDRGWRADIDWILKDSTNYVKILERSLTASYERESKDRLQQGLAAKKQTERYEKKREELRRWAKEQPLEALRQYLIRYRDPMTRRALYELRPELNNQPNENKGKAGDPVPLGQVLKGE